MKRVSLVGRLRGSFAARLSEERGVTLVLVTALLVVFMGMAAFAVDLGWLNFNSLEIQHGADVRDVDIDFQTKITVGKFVDRDRPTWHELSDKQHQATLGEKYYRHADMQAAQNGEKTHAKA